MNARVLALVAVIALGGLLWWQTRPSASAKRQGPASSGTVSNQLVPPPLDPSPIDPAAGEDGSGDDDHDWRPGDFDPADWQPGEEPIGWDRWVADFVRPRPGEGLLEYRDRLVPAAQMAIAPHRKAMARSLDRFAGAAGIDGAQRAAIDAIIAGSQERLKERIKNAVWGGELFGPQVRPIDGVRFARDLLDLVLAADAELRAALTPRQVEALETSGFDIAFYLLVATRWEQLIGVE